MITREALYSFVDTLINDANPSSALYGALTFRNLRTSVDEAEKVVRVETLDGEFSLTTENARKELNVRATIQCWMLPVSDEQTDIDDAIDQSFEMAREIFNAIAANPGLGGRVCDSSFEVFETGEANLGTVRRGVTYLDGTINQAS